MEIPVFNKFHSSLNCIFAEILVEQTSFQRILFKKTVCTQEEFVSGIAATWIILP
jgi:hypothetical protein